MIPDTKNKMKVLITGGAGYIGSHTCLEFLRAGYDVTVIDNLSNGSKLALQRVENITNQIMRFEKCDIRDPNLLKAALSAIKPDVVVHFAGVKSVADSIVNPVDYYDVNVGGTINLLHAMKNSGCSRIILSSSATVYGEPMYLPCDESHPLQPINAYGRSKLTAENLLEDWMNAMEGRKALALRYFNPVGADATGEIGENPLGEATNLMPILTQVATGTREHLKIFGTDYDTPDGTAIRDFIHVTDLAIAHINAVKVISTIKKFTPINVGRGKGISVFELVHEFEKATKAKIKVIHQSRRNGDAPAVWADTTLSKEILDFVAIRGPSEMCNDTWNWIRKNPQGYTSSLLTNPMSLISC